MLEEASQDGLADAASRVSRSDPTSLIQSSGDV